MLINGEASNDVEDVTLSTGERFLAIKIPTDDSKVEIIGTTIEPEFGPVAALLAATGLVGAVTITKYMRRISQKS